MEEKQWFLYVLDHHEGPYTKSEIAELINKGQVQPSNYVWKDGMADWIMMSDIPEFGSVSSKSDGHGKPTFVFPESQNSAHRTEFASSVASSSGPGDMDESVNNGSPQAPSSSGVSGTEEIWCLCSKHKYSGPHSMNKIVDQIKKNKSTVHDLVWREGWTSFVPISQLKDVMSLINGKNQTLVIAKRSAPKLGLVLGFILLLVVAALGVASHMGVLPNQIKNLRLSQNIAGLMSSVEALKSYLPDSIKPYLNSIALPDGFDAIDAQRLREASSQPLKNGVKLEFAILNKDVMNPSFIFASNAPDGTRFAFALRGVPNTLINSSGYEKVFQFEIKKGVAISEIISSDQNRSLARGEYGVFITETDDQPATVKQALSNIPKVSVPGLNPPQRIFFLTQNLFLGGKNDASYQDRLKEQKQKQAEALKQEMSEITQLVSTIESVANDGANLFFDLSQSKKHSSKEKKQWADLYGSHKKILAQLKDVLERNSETRIRKDLYANILELYGLTTQLSDLEQNYLSNFESKSTAKMDDIRSLASSLSTKLANIKVITSENK